MTTDTTGTDLGPIDLGSKIMFGLFLLIPVFYLLSMSNGVDPFGCPPGTKTVTSPTSIQKWCVGE